ncbi:MAG: hypothetical protein OHK0029_20070 [Armatimonadaceae bacterium]
MKRCPLLPALCALALTGTVSAYAQPVTAPTPAVSTLSSARKEELLKLLPLPKAYFQLGFDFSLADAGAVIHLETDEVERLREAQEKAHWQKMRDDLEKAGEPEELSQKAAFLKQKQKALSKLDSVKAAEYMAVAKRAAELYALLAEQAERMEDRYAYLLEAATLSCSANEVDAADQFAQSAVALNPSAPAGWERMAYIRSVAASQIFFRATGTEEINGSWSFEEL